MSFCIVYLASPRNSRIYEQVGNDTSRPRRIDLLRDSLKITRSCFPTTDIFVFHEDYTEDDRASLADSHIRFLPIDFSGLEEHRTPGQRRPYGYLMMCRFFSGVMQSHPEVAKYSHYMRLDDDSYFLEPFPTQEYVVSNLLKNDYVFRSVFEDSQDQQSLWKFTLEFLRKEGYGSHLETLKNELRKRSVLRGDTYTGLAPYNNFHIASQRLWQNPLTQRFLATLEESKGILRYGWMDANIHAMIAYVLALFMGMKIHHEATFGYRHNQHLSLLGSSAIHYKADLPFGLAQTPPTHSVPYPNTPPESTPDGSEDTH